MNRRLGSDLTTRAAAVPAPHTPRANRLPPRRGGLTRPVPWTTAAFRTVVLRAGSPADGNSDAEAARPP